MTKDNDQEKEQLFKDIKETGEVAKSIGKLLKDKVEVSFNMKQSDIDILESDTETLQAKVDELKDKTDEESITLKKTLEDTIAEISKKKNELSEDLVKAVLVPLKYREMRIVQTAVAEAVMTTEAMNFDLNVRIVMVMQEKKLMTVYLALRKHNSVSERYFPDGEIGLQEIVKLSDRTIEALYFEYIKNFVLTDDERKNS